MEVRWKRQHGSSGRVQRGGVAAVEETRTIDALRAAELKGSNDRKKKLLKRSVPFYRHLL
jgi:hypothetical protein